MDAANIKRLRTASALKELISEALSGLNDPFLNGLCVTDVECKRGRYDAFIYIDKMGFDEKEQSLILSSLKKAAPILQNHCMMAEGWYKAPNLHFKFDDRLEHQNRMDELFSQIKKELK